MLNKMKLGARLAAGFGVLILIALILGGLAIFNMNRVAEQSTWLAEEYIPEVAVSSDIRGAVNRLMYEMRGYGFTQEQKYWDEAQKELADLDKGLAQADDLAGKASHLLKLREQTGVIKQARTDYLAAADSTKATVAALDRLLKDLEKNAGVYMGVSKEFVDGQNAKFKQDLDQRQAKISLVSQLVDLGTTVRVTNFKAQATDDAALLERAIEELVGATKLTEKLRQITKDEEDLKVIDAIEAPAEDYRKAMKQFLVEFSKGQLANNNLLTNARSTMDASAARYTENCDRFLASQQAKLTKDMTERNTKIYLANSVLARGYDARLMTVKSVAFRDPEILKAGLKSFPLIEADLDNLRKITYLKADLDRIDQVAAAGRAYQETMGDYLNQWLKLQKLGQTRNDLGQKVILASKTMADAGMNHTSTIAVEAMDHLNQSSLIMIVGLSVALILGVILAVFMTKSITRPLAAVKGEVNRTAEGDLTVSLEDEYSRRGDELGDIARDVVQMNHDLQAVMSQITNAADQVSQGSNEISIGNQSLAERVQEQASAIEETAATIEEMTSSVKSNANDANSAADMAGNAVEKATQGGQVVEEAVTAMGLVQESSRQINDIIDVVNEIAFQTNLLALNASVEAARAGEAGRGFAVVAGEVRNLAQRSAEAAKQIQELIKDSVGKVEQGNRLVTKSGETLSEIISTIQDVADTISAISASAREQASAIDQINTAVSQLDEVTQQNASLVEETASTSEEMSAEAEALLQMVSRFKLDKNAPARQTRQIEAPARSASAAEPPRPARSSRPAQAAKPASKPMVTSSDDDFFDAEELEGFEKF